MTDRTLSLAYGTDPFDLSAVDVKRRERTRLLGAEAVVHVIGSSHYVAVPDLDLYELCSCEAVADAAATVPLTAGHAQSVCFETDAATVETVVETRPLASFPGPGAAAVAYRFGPDAYTTIDPDREGYETYHTYPERDLAVYTRSRLTERAGAPAAESVDSGDPVRSDGGSAAVVSQGVGRRAATEETGPDDRGSAGQEADDREADYGGAGDRGADDRGADASATGAGPRGDHQ